jgi:hypothetical protein
MGNKRKLLSGRANLDLLASLGQLDTVEAILDPRQEVRVRSMHDSAVVEIRVRSILSSGTRKLLASLIEILLRVLGISKNVSFTLDDEHWGSELVRTCTIVALLPVDKVRVFDPAGVLVEFLDSQVSVNRASGVNAALIGERNAAEKNVGGIVLNLDGRVESRNGLEKEDGNNVSSWAILGTTERLGDKLDRLKSWGNSYSTQEPTSGFTLLGLSLVRAPCSHSTLAVSNNDPFLGDLLAESSASSLKTETNVSSVESTRFIHETLRNIAALAGVIGGDDDVSLEGKSKGTLPLVVQTTMVARRTLTRSACSSMGPDDSAERLILSKGVRVGGQDESSSWNWFSIDVLSHIEESCQRDTTGNSPSSGSLGGWDLLPFDKITGGIL